MSVTKANFHVEEMWGKLVRFYEATLRPHLIMALMMVTIFVVIDVIVHVIHKQIVNDFNGTDFSERSVNVASLGRVNEAKLDFLF